MLFSLGNLNYYGFSKWFGFGHGDAHGGVLNATLEWEGAKKRISSIFIGISPELEIALYTLAALLKPGFNPHVTFPVSLGKKSLNLKTHVLEKHGQKFLLSAYPDIH